MHTPVSEYKQHNELQACFTHTFIINQEKFGIQMMFVEFTEYVSTAERVAFCSFYFTNVFTILSIQCSNKHVQVLFKDDFSSHVHFQKCFRTLICIVLLSVSQVLKLLSHLAQIHMGKPNGKTQLCTSHSDHIRNTLLCSNALVCYWCHERSLA